MQDDKTEVIKAEVAPVLAQAGAVVIRDAASYAVAGEFLKAIKAAQKRVADHFGPMKTAAHAAWKAITGKEAETLKPLQDAELMVKSRMVQWQTDQEQIRKLEEARLRAEAEARAEAERRRLEAAAMKLKTPELREQRLEQAAAVVAAPVRVESAVPVVKGQSFRKTWKATVTDKRELVNQIMAGWVDWEAFIQVNQNELDRLAARTKGSLTVAGVEFREVVGIASRGAE